MKFKVETDHKLLVTLLSSKALNSVPVRVQRFRLRLMRFDFTVTRADTLSRAPVGEADENELSQEIGNYVRVVSENLPASEERLQVIRDQQEQDPVSKKLKTYCLGNKIK